MPADGSYAKVENQRYGTPLLAAMTTHNCDSLRVLLAHEAEVLGHGILNDLNATVDIICKIYCNGEIISRRFGRNFQYWNDKSKLSSFGDTSILSRLDLYQDLALCLFLYDRGRFGRPSPLIEAEFRTPFLLSRIKAIASPIRILDHITDSKPKEGIIYSLFWSASENEDAGIKEYLIKSGDLDPNQRS